MHDRPHHGIPPDPSEDELRALRKLEDARQAELRAEAEMEHALSDIKEARHDIEAAEADLERAHHHLRVLHIKVDGEDYEATCHEMSPNDIIREFAGRDPSSNYLVELKGAGETVSFQGKGGDPIKLHDGEQFIVVSTGPATVSDGNRPVATTGVARFKQDLIGLGYKPRVIADDPNNLVIDYVVGVGKFAGKQVRLGFMVPLDFPMSPPSGPFVSPCIHPMTGSGGAHPTGGVHNWPHFNSAGGEWQYWSRPFPNWPASKRNAAAYLAHVLNLWANQ